MTDIQTALAEAMHQLGSNHPDNRTDAEVLLMAVLKKPRAFLYAHPECPLSTTEAQAFSQFIEQRVQGHPVAYLTGTREFWSMPLMVNQHTLIPRPETELLVELTLQALSHQTGAQILDLGTGSGAIALALAKERPDWQILACDISPDALAVARQNAEQFKLNNIRFIESNWYEAIDNTQRFHAIVSNPPYIARDDVHLQQGDLRFEPISALVSGEQGLTAIAHIIKNSLARLTPNGLLLIEHGFEQKHAIGSMLIEYGFGQIQCWKDWQGQDRVSGGRQIIVEA